MKYLAIGAVVLLAACSPETNEKLEARIMSSIELYSKVKEKGCVSLSETEKEQIRRLYPDPSKSICPEIK